jgi:ubiquitin C-terminal hydrolase
LLFFLKDIMNVHKKTAGSLNYIYSYLKEREQFYKISAINVLDIDLIPLLNQYEFQSKQFSSELLLFFTPEEKEESLQDKIKEQYKDLVNTFSRLESKILISKMYNYEKDFLRSYKEIAAMDLKDAKLKKLLESQCLYIKRNLEKLQYLKEHAV